MLSHKSKDLLNVRAVGVLELVDRLAVDEPWHCCEIVLSALVVVQHICN